MYRDSNSYWDLLASASHGGQGKNARILGQLLLLEIHLAPVRRAHKSWCQDSSKIAFSLFEIEKSSIKVILNWITVFNVYDDNAQKSQSVTKAKDSHGLVAKKPVQKYRDACD